MEAGKTEREGLERREEGDRAEGRGTGKGDGEEEEDLCVNHKVILSEF